MSDIVQVTIKYLFACCPFCLLYCISMYLFYIATMSRVALTIFILYSVGYQVTYALQVMKKILV